MKLHVDLETLQLIEGPGFRNPVNTLRFKRGDGAQLEVSFLENGLTPVAIGDAGLLSIRFGIKPRNRYDTGYLVHSDDWTLPASGAENPVYQCSPSFNTVQLDSALQVGSATGSELAEVTLMGEITWREGDGAPTSTRTFLVVVENDVNRGTEGVPTDAEPPYPAPGDLITAAIRYDLPQILSAAQKSQARSNIGGDRMFAHIAFVKNGAAGAGEIGNSEKPFATIRAAYAALVGAALPNRNIVLLNSGAELFPFVPTAGDLPFHIVAAMKSSRSASELFPSQPAANVSINGWSGEGTWLRISSDRSVGVLMPGAMSSPYAGEDILIDCEGLAAFDLYTSNGPGAITGSLFVTLRDSGNLNINIENLSNATSVSPAAYFLLIRCGSSNSAIYLGEFEAAPYFENDFSVNAVDCLFGYNSIDTALVNSITLAGCGHGAYSVYSSGLIDGGGNYYNENW